MTEPKKAFENAVLDAESLEQFVNGSDAEVVLTRLSAEYPTLQNAIRQMFTLGGLPVDRFETLAELQTSQLPDDSYAFVSDDTENTANGVYIKKSGDWVKSRYDTTSIVARVVNANALFKPDVVNDPSTPLSGYNTGIHYLHFSKGDVPSDFPPVDNEYKNGVFINYDYNFIGYQFFVHYNTGVVYSRYGNGGTRGSSFSYYPWQKSVTQGDLNEVVNNTPKTIFVAQSGSDSNSGTEVLSPVKTIGKAVDLLTRGGEIVVLDSYEYREHVNITSRYHITIRALKNSAVNIFGSDKLELTKSGGYTKVYQAPLAQKPTGMGGDRGKPMIAEWGTPSKPIPASERHYLHHGLTHRLPYTEMFEVGSVEEVEASNGVWFWQDGIIYLSATNGGDASKKRYEARARSTLSHFGESIELIRVNCWFSNARGMHLNGLKTIRRGCKVFGSRHDGFADNANTTLSIRDESAGNGNDGFNLTFSTSRASNPEMYERIEAVYIDPYGHDNGDDGLSCHYRSDSTVLGGLFEYNTKADVVHVTGAACVCFNTVSRGAESGFYAATSPTLDPERTVTTFKCVGTVSYNNNYAYRAADDALLQCDSVKAIQPRAYGFYQSGSGSINALDCSIDADNLKYRSGNVIISTTAKLS